MLAFISPTYRIARHEWMLILKEPRFLIPFLITPLFLVGVQAFMLYFKQFTSEYEIQAMARSLLMMLAVLAPSVAVPLGADTFAGEKERNTFEILLCLPVNMSSLFWGKVLGIFPLPVLMGWAGQVVIVLMLRDQGQLHAEFASDVMRAMILTPFLGLFLCAFSALISLIVGTVRSAAQLTSLAMLAILFLVMFGATFMFANLWFFCGFLSILTLGSVSCLLLARLRFSSFS